jgi:drug/metabolite transporter (DMT)-like permease
VTRSYVPLLLLLAAIWGASYMFIKVAVDELEPGAMMFLRMAIAFALLFAFVLALEGRAVLRELRDVWRPGLVLGTINGAIPFTLIAWGEKYIDSGVAAIANASVPIFVTLLAIRYRPSERATGARLVGVGLGLLGVALLASARPEGSWWYVAGTLAVVLASFSYAGGGIYGQGSVARARGPVLATASMGGGALVLLPLALFQIPDSVPGWKVAGSVAALAVVGTAFAQLILFRMLALHGAARLSLVTYLMPAIALVYGALLLDEPITMAMIGGMALILAGVALGSGVARLPARREVGATPAP